MGHRGFFEIAGPPGDRAAPCPGDPLPVRGSDPTAWLRRAAPTLGQHNDEVLGGELGLTDAELAALRATGIIGDRPAGT